MVTRRSDNHLGHDDLDRSTFTSSERRQFHMPTVRSCATNDSSVRSVSIPFGTAQMRDAGLASLTHDREVMIKRPLGIHEPLKALRMRFHIITYLAARPA